MTFACGVVLVFVQNVLNQNYLTAGVKVEMERKTSSARVCAARGLVSARTMALMPSEVRVNSALHLNSTLRVLSFGRKYTNRVILQHIRYDMKLFEGPRDNYSSSIELYVA